MNAVTAAVQNATNKTDVRAWSPYQSALFDWAANGLGNIMVMAVAGSGKTTTGVEMTRRMRGRHIYLAFNKAIATELSTRGVNGKTFHSLCYGPVLQLIRAIGALFADAAGGVKLATIHKSKGLEADRVFWLNRSKCPSLWARQEWQQDQEANLCYVATTRAKKALFMIEEKE